MASERNSTRLDRRATLLSSVAFIGGSMMGVGSVARSDDRSSAAIPKRDDTAKINARLATAKVQGYSTLDLAGAHLVIQGRLVIDGIVLRNFTAELAGPSASVRLTGSRPGVHDYQIDHGSSGPFFGKEEGGVFNLHVSRGATIGRGSVTGQSRRAAVSCVTRADQTIIDGLVSYTAWGVIFNDQSNRNVDGVDYADMPIGSGLIVQNCRFNGHAANTASGDGLEINVPRRGFSEIVVRNCIVTKTIYSPSVGIGFGMAGVRDAVIDNCIVTNCQSPAGAFHAEWSDNVIIQSCEVIDSEVGASVSMAGVVTIRDCLFKRCRINAIQSYNQFPRGSKRKDTGRETTMLVVEGCTFGESGARSLGRTGVDLIAARVGELQFNNNVIHIPVDSVAPRIAIKAFLGKSVDRLVIRDNHFFGSPGLIAPIAIATHPLPSVDVSGNRFDNDSLRKSFADTFVSPRLRL